MNIVLIVKKDDPKDWKSTRRQQHHGFEGRMRLFCGELLDKGGSHMMSCANVLEERSKDDYNPRVNHNQPTPNRQY